MNEKRLPPRLMVLLLATKLKQAIHEVFENEKKKGGLMDKEPSLEPMESSIIREALYLLTPQLP